MMSLGDGEGWLALENHLREITVRASLVMELGG